MSVPALPTSASDPSGAEVSAFLPDALDDRDLVADHRLRRARLTGSLRRGAAPVPAAPTWRHAAGGLLLCVAALGGTVVVAVVRHELPSSPSVSSVGVAPGPPSSGSGVPSGGPAPAPSAPGLGPSAPGASTPPATTPSTTTRPTGGSQPYGNLGQNFAQTSR